MRSTSFLRSSSSVRNCEAFVCFIGRFSFCSLDPFSFGYTIKEEVRPPETPKRWKHGRGDVLGEMGGLQPASGVASTFPTGQKQDSFRRGDSGRHWHGLRSHCRRRSFAWRQCILAGSNFTKCWRGRLDEDADVDADVALPVWPACWQRRCLPSSVVPSYRGGGSCRRPADGDAASWSPRHSGNAWQFGCERRCLRKNSHGSLMGATR